MSLISIKKLDNVSKVFLNGVSRKKWLYIKTCKKLKHQIPEYFWGKKNTSLLHNHWFLGLQEVIHKMKLNYMQVLLMLIELGKGVMFHLSKPKGFWQFRRELLFLSLMSINFFFLFKNFTLIFRTFEETYYLFFYMNQMIQSFCLFNVYQVKIRVIP